MMFAKAYADFAQRLRVPAGFVLLATFAWLSRPSAFSIEVGLPVSILGLLLRGWAAGHLAKNEELATSGPFGYVRNPLYLGTLITAAGLVVAAREMWLVVIFGAAFVFVYLPAIELEEQHLREIFPGYADYAARIQRFLPLAKWTGTKRGFSLQLYRRNEEYKALGGFLIAVGWLTWKYCVTMRSA
jgi:protein-S-isoprenylcysteine O-methyltransferase Ste14